MKKVLVILMTLVMVFAMTACGGGSSEAPAGTITVEIEIDYPDESGVADVEEFEFQVAEGTTALDMLHAFGEENNVEIVMSDTSATAYVTSIGGIAETDGAGWVYEVDGEMTLDAANEYVVKNGSEITWEFMSWGDM